MGQVNRAVRPLADLLRIGRWGLDPSTRPLLPPQPAPGRDEPQLLFFLRRNNIAPTSPVRTNDQLPGSGTLSGTLVAEKKNGSISPVVSMAPALTSPNPAKVP